MRRIGFVAVTGLAALCRCGHERVYHEKLTASHPDGRCLHPGVDGLSGPCPCRRFVRDDG